MEKENEYQRRLKFGIRSCKGKHYSSALVEFKACFNLSVTYMISQPDDTSALYSWIAACYDQLQESDRAREVWYACFRYSQTNFDSSYKFFQSSHKSSLVQNDATVLRRIQEKSLGLEQEGDRKRDQGDRIGAIKDYEYNILFERGHKVYSQTVVIAILCRKIAFLMGQPDDQNCSQFDLMKESILNFLSNHKVKDFIQSGDLHFKNLNFRKALECYELAIQNRNFGLYNQIHQEYIVEYPPSIEEVKEEHVKETIVPTSKASLSTMIKDLLHESNSCLVKDIVKDCQIASTYSTDRIEAGLTSTQSNLMASNARDILKFSQETRNHIDQVFHASTKSQQESISKLEEVLIVRIEEPMTTKHCMILDAITAMKNTLLEETNKAQQEQMVYVQKGLSSITDRIIEEGSNHTSQIKSSTDCIRQAIAGMNDGYLSSTTVKEQKEAISQFQMAIDANAEMIRQLLEHNTTTEVGLISKNTGITPAQIQSSTERFIESIITMKDEIQLLSSMVKEQKLASTDANTTKEVDVQALSTAIKTQQEYITQLESTIGMNTDMIRQMILNNAGSGKTVDKDPEDLLQLQVSAVGTKVEMIYQRMEAMTVFTQDKNNRNVSSRWWYKFCLILSLLIGLLISAGASIVLMKMKLVNIPDVISMLVQEEEYTKDHPVMKNHYTDNNLESFRVCLGTSK